MTWESGILWVTDMPRIQDVVRLVLIGPGPTVASTMWRAKEGEGGESCKECADFHVRSSVFSWGFFRKIQLNYHAVHSYEKAQDKMDYKGNWILGKSKEKNWEYSFGTLRNMMIIFQYQEYHNVRGSALCPIAPESRTWTCWLEVIGKEVPVLWTCVSNNEPEVSS